MLFGRIKSLKHYINLILLKIMGRGFTSFFTKLPATQLAVLFQQDLYRSTQLNID